MDLRRRELERQASTGDLEAWCRLHKINPEELVCLFPTKKAGTRTGTMTWTVTRTWTRIGTRTGIWTWVRIGTWTWTRSGTKTGTIT